MTLTEKFTSLEQFQEHFVQILSQTIKVNKYIYFMLRYPEMFEDTNDILRSYYNDPSAESRAAIERDVRLAYRQRVQNAAIAPIAEEDQPSDYDIDLSIDSLMYDTSSPPIALTPMYLYPWPKAKFQQRFYADVFPANVRHYFATLQASNHLTFKKSYTLITCHELDENLVASLLKDDGLTVLSKLNINEVLNDLYETIDFYKGHYEKALADNCELQNMIDGLSQHITQQSLTRWY